MNLKSLSADEIKDLSVNDLIKRMDNVRYFAEIERYGSDWVISKEEHFPYPRVADIFSIDAVINMNESKKRRLADAAFRFLLQLDMLIVSSGISNTVINGPNYDKAQWKSPNHWMKAAVLDQYQIIASRIALECFFDLIYIADCGARMSGRSKFSTFRKWVVKKDNPYIYFVGHIIKAFSFDRLHRQREVHGTSRYAHCLLRLEIPDTEEINISNELTNVLLSVWKPFLQILNGDRPNSIAIFDSCNNFAEKYFESDDDPVSFEIFIADILSEHMT
jgi:hypothetical protein